MQVYSCFHVGVLLIPCRCSLSLKHTLHDAYSMPPEIRSRYSGALCGAFIRGLSPLYLRALYLPLGVEEAPHLKEHILL